MPTGLIFLIIFLCLCLVLLLLRLSKQNQKSSAPRVSASDDSELVAVLTAAIFAHRKSQQVQGSLALPPHGFIIRRIRKLP